MVDLETLSESGLLEGSAPGPVHDARFPFAELLDNLRRPDVFPDESIAHTGTHDNATLLGWWQSLDIQERAAVARHHQFHADDPIGKIVWSLNEAALAGWSRVAVIPLQDLLVLDERARMNNPAVLAGNGDWRLPPGGLSDELARSLRRLRDRYRWRGSCAGHGFAALATRLIPARQEVEDFLGWR